MLWLPLYLRQQKLSSRLLYQGRMRMTSAPLRTISVLMLSSTTYVVSTLLYVPMRGLGVVVYQTKSLTFGDACIQGKLNPAYQHSLDLKIVGGSLKSQTSDVGPTQVEEERLAKWKGTITRLKHAPLHWQRKAKMLVATQSQAVYA